jgi:hypothetical protein
MVSLVCQCGVSLHVGVIPSREALLCPACGQPLEVTDGPPVPAKTLVQEAAECITQSRSLCAAGRRSLADIASLCDATRRLCMETKALCERTPGG